MATAVTRRIKIYVNGKEVNATLSNLKKSLREFRARANQATEGKDNWKKYNKEVARLEVELNQATQAQKQFRNQTKLTEKGVKSSTTSFSRFKRSLKDIFFPVSGAILFTDALKAGLQFTKQFIQDAVLMAEEAKGVEFAFKRLGEEGESAFNRVKESTRGLLSDLEIKKSLVEFDNFNISLDETDTLFEFLSLRAAQTGQSVDKLKQSLVEGLSKESKLRIDNLGISATQLNKELEKTPDFVQAVANIAKTEIVRAGSILDDAASSSQKWNATLQNTKLRLGNIVNSSGIITYFQKLGTSFLEAITPAEDLTKSIKKQQIDLNILAQKITDVNTTEVERTKNINILQTKYPGFLKNLNAESVSNQEIRDRLAEVNKGYIAKITLTQLSQDVEEKAKESSEQLTDAFNSEELARKTLNKTIGVAETNRLLETKSLKEATEEALKNAGVTEDLVKDALKFETKGVKILDSKQRALLSVRRSLQMSKLSEDESNKTRGKATELQNKLNRFTEKYAEVLKEVENIDGTNGNNDDDSNDEPTEEEIQKALAAREDFERRKLKLQNEAALRAEEDEFKRKEIKIKQDTIAQQAEIDALEISAQKKQELKALIAQQEADLLAEVNAEKEAKELERLQAFEEKKRALENEIELSRATSDEEREIIKAEQDAEAEALQLEKMQVTGQNLTDALALIEERRVAIVEGIRKKYRDKEAKAQEDFNKKQLELEDRLQKAKAAAGIAAIKLAQDVFGKKTAIGKLLFLFEKGKAINDIIIANAAAKAKIAANLGVANAVSLAASPLTFGQPMIANNTALAAKDTLIASLTAGAQIATIAGSTLKGFEQGGFTENNPTVALDGNKRVTGFTHDFEYVVPTFVRQEPEVPAILNYLEQKRQAKLNGTNTQDVAVSNTNRATSTTEPTTENTVNVELLETIGNLNTTLQNLKINFTLDDEINRQDLQEKLNQTIKASEN